MAGAQEPKETTSVFDCPICLEKFKSPVNLPCLHTFCDLCLDTYIESTVGGKYVKLFKCPLCQMNCELQRKTTKKWTSQFPSNNLISTIMSIEGNAHEKLLLDNCDPCQRIGEHVKAVKWCSDCKEAYCYGCAENFHNRVRNAHSHTVSLINSDQSIPDFFDMKVDEPCLKHKGRQVEVVCRTHFALCCVICLTDEHSECNDFRSIDDIIPDIRAGKFGEKFKADLDHIYSEIRDLINFKETQIEALQNQKERLILDVNSTINDVIQCLETLKKEVNEKVSFEDRLAKKTRQLEIDTLRGVQSNIIQSVKLLEILSGYENPKQLFYLLLKMKPNFTEHNTLFSGRDLVEKHAVYNLKIDPMLHELAAKRSMFCIVDTKTSKLEKSESRISVETRLQTLIGHYFDMVGKQTPKHGKKSKFITRRAEKKEIEESHTTYNLPFAERHQPDTSENFTGIATQQRKPTNMLPAFLAFRRTQFNE